MNKSIQDFKEYIAYVIALYRIIKVRRNKVKLGDKKHHLEYRVLQRVKNLYEMAATRFPQEVNLYFAFFQFCKEANFQHGAQKMCQMMLKYHKNKEEVWLTAARLYFHVRKDHLQAIKLLQEGIGIHSTSLLLYKECIVYEILSATKGELSDDDKTKLISKLEIYFNQAKKHVKEYSFFTNLLTFLLEYGFAVGIQMNLLKFLKESFSDCVKIWQYIAERELEGIHIDMDKGEIVCIPCGKAFMNCISTYEEGLEKISNENKQELWNIYLQCIADFRNRKDFNKVPNYTRLAINAFEKAAAEEYLNETFFFVWLELVSDDKKAELVKYATEKCPKSVDLWLLRFRIDIEKSKINCKAIETMTEKIEETFSLGCKNLIPSETLPLWEAMHDFKVTYTSMLSSKQFYLMALNEHLNISSVFKPKYIYWLGKRESIEEARKAYKTLVKLKPYNKKMYEVMLALELDEEPLNLDELEYLYKTACELIGDESSDVWLDYAQFCAELKPLRAGRDTIAKIVIEAKMKLREGLFTDFEERYDEMVQIDQRKKLCKST